MLEQRIADALAALLAAEGLPGAVAMVGSRAGVLAQAAVGRRGPDGPPLGLDTLFQLASMTKAITSVAALQLVEQGRLGLDDDIGTVLPELADPKVLEGFADDGTPALRPAAGPVTLRHLLTHTSGLGYEFMDAHLARWRQGRPAVPGTRAALTAPLRADPGTAWIYGTSTDWVGLAVEAVTGMRLGDWFARHIFTPLGMADTGFGFGSDVKARLMPLLARQADGALAPFPIHFGGGERAEVQSGGGGLTGTAADYLRFLRMLLNGGSLDGARILRPETVAALMANQIGAIAAGHMTSTMPGLTGDFDYFPEMRCGWGLAFLLNPLPGPDGRAAGSGAWSGIANTWYWLDPAHDRAVVLMMQHLPFGDPAALRVMRGLERAVYAA